MALREVVRNPNLRVEALLTTIACDYDRVSMHGVRRASLERQADSLGIPLHRIPISKNATTLDGSRRAMGPKNTIRSISCGQRPANSPATMVPQECATSDTDLRKFLDTSVL